jgi:hypothetical protein
VSWCLRGRQQISIKCAYRSAAQVPSFAEGSPPNTANSTHPKTAHHRMEELSIICAGGVKNCRIFSNVSILFSNVSVLFSNVSILFSNVFKRFLHELARLVLPHFTHLPYFNTNVIPERCSLGHEQGTCFYLKNQGYIVKYHNNYQGTAYILSSDRQSVWGFL